MEISVLLKPGGCIPEPPVQGSLGRQQPSSHSVSHQPVLDFAEFAKLTHRASGHFREEMAPTRDILIAMNFFGSRRPVAAAMETIACTLRGKYGNRYGASKGGTAMTSKRGPRDFYKGKGAPSTGRLTSKGKRTQPCPPPPPWCHELTMFSPTGAAGRPCQARLTGFMCEQVNSSSRRRSSSSSWFLTSKAAR